MMTSQQVDPQQAPFSSCSTAFVPPYKHLSLLFFYFTPHSIGGGSGGGECVVVVNPALHTATGVVVVYCRDATPSRSDCAAGTITTTTT